MFLKSGLRRTGCALLLAVLALTAKSVSASTTFSVFASGQDTSGQLGDGASVSQQNSPVGIYPGASSPIIALAGGASHSLALAANGTVFAWGLNSSGQLGDGTTTNRPNAVQVKISASLPLTGVVAISAGNGHSLALTATGQIYAWGLNDRGQLGDGTTASRSNPVLISGISGVVAIAAGSSHSLALLGNGSVYAWGYNIYGQLGMGSTDALPHSAPAAVPGLTGITAIAAGSFHSLALSGSGGVAGWGNNLFGQLGDGTNVNRVSPVTMLAAASIPMTGVTAITAGVYHTALLVSGAVYGVGYNFFGELGDGTTTNRAFPAPTILANVQTLVAGGYHTVAVSAGKSFAWGENNYGELGDGTTTNRAIPTATANIGTVQAIGAGTYHSLLVTGTAGTSVNAALSFENISGNANNQGVTLLFVPTDGSARFTRLQSFPENGLLTLINVPKKNYTLWVKGAKYLAELDTLNATAAVPALSATQLAGDGNNDNVVDTTDFNLLVGAFGSAEAVSGSGYEEPADFDGSRSVDTTDFNLLAGNFGTAGAAVP